jgi:hypothetical protein
MFLWMTTMGNITNWKKEKNTKKTKFKSKFLATNTFNLPKNNWENFGEMCLSRINFTNSAIFWKCLRKTPEVQPY